MIIRHKTGGAGRATFEEVKGRICLHSDDTEWKGVKKPFRVMIDDGRAVIGHELRREWNNEDRDWRYFDDCDLRSDIRVDKAAIQVSCDTAAEVRALLEVSRVAFDELRSIRKVAAARMAALVGKSIASDSDVRLLSLEDRDDWIDPHSGKTLLSIPHDER